MLGGSEGGPLSVLGHGLIVQFFVVEPAHGWFHIVSLSHLEVLSEVLVSAPPVSVDHGHSLVSSHLMEVGVSDIVLLPVHWEPSVSVRRIVVLVNLADVPFPLGDHALLLLLGQQVEHKRLVQMPDQEHPAESNPILVGQRGHLPESISEWVFKETRDVLEGSPFLSHVSWLTGFVYKFGEVAVGLFSQGSSDHVSSLMHVWVTIHQPFNTSQPLSEV